MSIFARDRYIKRLSTHCMWGFAAYRFEGTFRMRNKKCTQRSRAGGKERSSEPEHKPRNHCDVQARRGRTSGLSRVIIIYTCTSHISRTWHCDSRFSVNNYISSLIPACTIFMNTKDKARVMNINERRNFAIKIGEGEISEKREAKSLRQRRQNIGGYLHGKFIRGFSPHQRSGRI